MEAYASLSDYMKARFNLSRSSFNFAIRTSCFTHFETTSSAQTSIALS